jgi:hypothetical protein
MVLLKRNLEGSRVHSYCSLHCRSPRTVSFSIWGFFCCFDSSTAVSEQHVCKLVSGLGNGILLQWRKLVNTLTV